MQALLTLPRAGRILAHLISSLLLLALPLSACPTCSVGQALETLALVLAFLGIPYVVVTGVWFCMKRLLAGEEVES